MLSNSKSALWMAALLAVTVAAFFGCGRTEDPAGPTNAETENQTTLGDLDRQSNSWGNVGLAKPPEIAPPDPPLASFNTSQGTVLVGDYFFDQTTEECVIGVHIENGTGGYDFRAVRIADQTSLPGGQGLRGSIQSPAPGSRIDMDFAFEVEADGSLVLLQNVSQGTDTISHRIRTDATSGLVTTTANINGSEYTVMVDPSGQTQPDPDYEQITAAATTEYQYTSLDEYSVDRERLKALIGDLGFMNWLVRVGGIAANIPDSVIDDAEVEVSDRWIDSEGYQQACGWAGATSIAFAYCWPVCAPIIVPSVGVSAACGVVFVVETVGGWFGWWD